MRRSIILLSLWAVVYLSSAAAKEWKGAVPGVTTRKEVLEKFGPPTKEFSKGGELANGISYQGDQAIEGAVEANFYFDRREVLFRIDVFPARELTREQIVRIFGKKYLERTSSSGNVYFQYPKEGLTVFFDKNGQQVFCFIFTVPASPGEEKSRGGKKKMQE